MSSRRRRSWRTSTNGPSQPYRSDAGSRSAGAGCPFVRVLPLSSLVIDLARRRRLTPAAPVKTPIGTQLTAADAHEVDSSFITLSSAVHRPNTPSDDHDVRRRRRRCGGSRSLAVRSHTHTHTHTHTHIQGVVKTKGAVYCSVLKRPCCCTRSHTQN